jgi:phage protein D
MSDNKHLAPVCIIYVDGVRLSTACEGAFRSVKVFDVLNKISECSLSFDWQELGGGYSKHFPFTANLSVHLGYKDNMNEVFNGEITANKISHNKYTPSTYTIRAMSALRQLNHAMHKRTFENKTPSQAVKDLLSRYGLQADCDNFGHSRPYWEGGAQTDWELISEQAKRYGKDIYSFGKKVFVKEQMTMHKKDFIYEWGKSLIDFRVKEDIRTLTGSVQVIGWDMTRAKGFRAKKSLDDISQKVGGKSAWTKLSKNGDKWVDNVFDNSLADEKEASELALALMREQSFKYMRAEGKGEGNAELAAGSMVTVKYVGAAYSGEYIAETVVHDFSLEDGFTTEFYLKRNMLDDEFVKKMKGGTGGAGGGKSAASQKDENSSEDEKNEKEDEDKPEFRSLKWKKDGKETTEALVDDNVSLFCEVKNIDDGQTVKFKIFEEGKSKYDTVDEVEGEVKNGKVEAPWKVVFKGEEGSAVAEEIEEQGYTIPDYCFYARYGGTESNESAKLKTHNVIRKQLFDEDTGDKLSNTKYEISLSDGTKIKGTTDENGYMEKIQIDHFAKIEDITLGDE